MNERNEYEKSDNLFKMSSVLAVFVVGIDLYLPRVAKWWLKEIDSNLTMARDITCMDHEIKISLRQWYLPGAIRHVNNC